ncbi:MAG: tetratricopeptide repeat protein [Planctomycetota bacterium]
MPGPVVFAFAVADGLVPVPGAAPYDVLARQLPRLLVAHLNGKGDRGARFFPFLGPLDGKRTFLRPGALFEPAVLAQLHKQGAVPLLVDGILRGGLLHWRCIDGETLTVRSAVDLPFDPRRPLDVMARLEFELTDHLGWGGRPWPPASLTGEALAWLLVLKDELLRREANLPDQTPDPLRAARRCVDLAAADPDVHETVGDFTAMLLRRREHRADCAAVLTRLAAATTDDVARLERLDALLLAAGDEANAATVACRAARLRPERADLVERAAAQAFRLGRYDDVRMVVEPARARGVASPGAIAQLMAVCDRTDDHTMRSALVKELVGLHDLPVPVARLVVLFLLEEEQPALARVLLERALSKEPGHAMLHFEHGRACLMLGDGPHAAASLQRALQLGLQPVVAGQARRFARLAAVPGLWLGAQRVEKAIAAADLAQALGGARELLRNVGPVAEAWLLLGIVYHKLGRLRRAERVLRRSLRADRESPEAHNRLGILLVATGRVPEGHDLLQRAHQLAPADPSPLLHLAQACAMLGRMPDAEAHVAAAERAGADPQLVQAVRAEILAGRS